MVPTIGANSSIDWSIIASARRRSSGRCRWRTPATAPRVPLDFDHATGRVQLFLEPAHPLPQPGVLPLYRVDRCPPRLRRQRLEGAPVALLTPFRDQRHIQTLPAQQRTLAVTIQALVFGEDLQLVLRRIRPAFGPLRDLRIRMRHLPSMTQQSILCSNRHSGILLSPPSQHSDSPTRPVPPEVDTEGPGS